MFTNNSSDMINEFITRHKANIKVQMAFLGGWWLLNQVLATKYCVCVTGLSGISTCLPKGIEPRTYCTVMHE